MRTKTHNNHVEAFGPDGESLGIVFATATPFDTPRLMTELVDWMRVTLDGDELHPLITIALSVVVFLEIHPFQDGNGRLSRILTTLLLLRAGYAYVPYCSLESVIEQSQGGVLPGASADARHHPDRQSRLATVANLLSRVASTTEEQACT